MRNDYQIGLKLRDKYKGKYLELKYEDYFNNPFSKTLEILSFLGMNMTSDVRTYIAQHVNYNNPNPKP